MKNNNNFTTAISNEEHLVRVKETYNKEVLPFLKENRKAYDKHVQQKTPLTLTPAQKASLECQNLI
ncbi:hypothetical protein DI383_09580 [Flavobacteriaceae bacterium LYZ1037]|jgi:hypothetical protein|nr:hypothetical protein DI383_09580 [Flavobacteriaceae bacterium LYZ1037]